MDGIKNVPGRLSAREIVWRRQLVHSGRRLLPARRGRVGRRIGALVTTIILILLALPATIAFFAGVWEGWSAVAVLFPLAILSAAYVYNSGSGKLYWTAAGLEIARRRPRLMHWQDIDCVLLPAMQNAYELLPHKGWLGLLGSSRALTCRQIQIMGKGFDETFTLPIQAHQRLLRLLGRKCLGAFIIDDLTGKIIPPVQGDLDTIRFRMKKTVRRCRRKYFTRAMTQLTFTAALGALFVLLFLREGREANAIWRWSELIVFILGLGFFAGWLNLRRARRARQSLQEMLDQSVQQSPFQEVRQ